MHRNDEEEHEHGATDERWLAGHRLGGAKGFYAHKAKLEAIGKPFVNAVESYSDSSEGFGEHHSNNPVKSKDALKSYRPEHHEVEALSSGLRHPSMALQKPTTVYTGLWARTRGEEITNHLAKKGIYKPLYGELKDGKSYEVADREYDEAHYAAERDIVQEKLHKTILGNMREGAIFHSPRFVSASHQVEVAKTFAMSSHASEEHPAHIINWHLPAGYNRGADIAPISHIPDEDEFILDRNQHFRVGRIEKKGKEVHYHLHAVEGNFGPVSVKGNF